MQVRVVEFNATTPFKEQLEVMASSAVLISVHTSNLANAPFLQPGSAVIELIQRNWIWHNLDRSFQVFLKGPKLYLSVEHSSHLVPLL